MEQRERPRDMASFNVKSMHITLLVPVSLLNFSTHGLGNSPSSLGSSVFFQHLAALSAIAVGRRARDDSRGREHREGAGGGMASTLTHSVSANYDGGTLYSRVRKCSFLYASTIPLHY